MSEHNKGLFQRVWEGMLGLVNRVCPNCGHDVNIHGENDRCLGAVYDHGVHLGWCECDSLVKKQKEKAK